MSLDEEDIIEEELLAVEMEEYKCIIHNDDKTSIDFVIFILTTIFNINMVEAYNITMKAHKKGSAVCGIYMKEIAETKKMNADRLSKGNNYPLKITIEKV